MTMSGQRLLEQANRDVFFTDLNACNEFTNGAELAPGIEAETLVIIGKQDKMTAAVSAGAATRHGQPIVRKNSQDGEIVKRESLKGLDLGLGHLLS